MQAEANRCPQCGEVLPGEALRGLCPKCLMKEGLESTVGFEEASGSPSGPDHSASGELPEPGEEFGAYRIGRLLGTGGMGTVYEAEHTESGRHVALKVLGHKLQSPQHRQRFLREGRLAASINHPNNVYIYGTEEIDGTPVISMELARGGTLRDCVKRDGPLPVGQAVDVILDIIAGLEAAQAGGVLHRDIKPSNCFVDTDGTVKVGDFGLSISTEPRGETNLTQSGLFLGTPAFSSPEQLRGDELDIRSDIYSVGVTLYYLLTGQTPFHAKQMVQLLATVLERPAPSPRSVRFEVPPGLAKVVLCCLAKQSKDRFKSYDELRQALLPYTSQAPTPGTLGFRFLANGIDYIATTALAALLPLMWFTDFQTWNLQFDAISGPGPQTPELMLFSGVGMLLQLAYFAVLEGIWGAAVGKAICRLRVVRPHREAAGVPRALLRATIFLAAGWLPWWGLYAFDPEVGIAAFAGDDWALSWITLAIYAAALLLLFCTMRRRNGYAGLHELSSGTRVVRIQTRQQRPTLSLMDEPLPDMQDAQKTGPYHVLGQLDAEQPHELLLAYDTRLLRKVWIRKGSVGVPPVPPELRKLARIGRLRWLCGGCDSDGPWDAYEAPQGKPLLNLFGDPQPWEAVRFWLLDLAEELSASLKDGPFPSALELDRVWITADGRAKLLDFPAPGLDAERRVPSASALPGRAAATVRIFLKRVAIAALEGHVLSCEDVQARDVSALLPSPARAFLNELDRPEDAAIPTSQLESFTRKPASVSLERRAGALAACCFPLLMLAVLIIPTFFAEKQFLQAHPEVGELSRFVSYYQSLEKWDSDAVRNGASIAELREAIEIHVAGRFRSTINNREIWSDSRAGEFVDVDGQGLLEGFVEAHPDPSREEVVKAEARLQPILGEIWWMGSTLELYEQMTGPTGLLGMVTGFLIVFVVLPSLVSYFPHISF